jgi:hypothetical protein
MRLILAALVIACVPATALSQTAAPSADRDAILATVQKFFDTMAAKDAVEARRILMPGGRIFFVVPDENNQPTVRARTFEEYLDRLPGQKQKLLERFWNPDVRIHGFIAVVWAPYDFWTDGKFSHCGVDSFDFVKTPEGWKISGGIYTVERTGCVPSPLGPVK